MERDLLSIILRNAINQVGLNSKQEFVKVYAFGSISKVGFGEDLDLLIIFDKEYIHANEIIDFKTSIGKRVHSELQMAVDFLTFTKSEAKNYKIVKRVKGRLIEFSYYDEEND